jgi:acyl-CoA dehydrogenase
MDFSIPEALQSRLDEVRAFVRREIIPLEKTFLQRGFRTVEPELQAKRVLVRAMGLLTPHVAKAHGGAGLSLVEFGLLAEVLGQSPLGHYSFNCQAPDAGNMELLAQHGTHAQQERFLAPLVNGSIRSCFAMTEPERPGSNPTWLGTSARLAGDSWVVDGRKWFTSGADGASFAIVMAVTNPDAAEAHRRASQILVPCDTPGFRIVRNISVMGEPGEGWASHAEVVFENVRVPRENLVGLEGKGFALAQDRLGPGRIHHCMRWMGICERAFTLLCERAATREIAPGVMLGSKQMVQEWIADSRAEMDAARLMVLRAAWTMDTKGAAAARDEISTIKFFASGVLLRVLDRAIQAHGALGITDDTPLAWWYRHERGARIYDGADEVHKAALAKRLLARHGYRE